MMIARRQFLLFTLIAPLVIGGVACSDQPDTFGRLPSGSKVVALGDSLTFGYGVDNTTQSYPVLLAHKTGWQVVNMGINGNTTQDVLERLDSVIAQKPALVLLGIGGNDVLRRVSSEQTKANLIQIINTLQTHNIPAVLIAQPHLSASALFGRASDNPVYDEVAQQTGVLLFDRAWSKILSDDKLKSDQIHANAAGYALFVEQLYEFLGQVGYV